VTDLPSGTKIRIGSEFEHLYDNGKDELIVVAPVYEGPFQAPDHAVWPTGHPSAGKPMGSFCTEIVRFMNTKTGVTQSAPRAWVVEAAIYIPGPAAIVDSRRQPQMPDQIRWLAEMVLDAKEHGKGATTTVISLALGDWAERVLAPPDPDAPDLEELRREVERCRQEVIELMAERDAYRAEAAKAQTDRDSYRREAVALKLRLNTIAKALG